MKYLTPKRLLAYRSLDDEAADKAHEDWEEQLLLYEARLKAITLPESVRLFTNTISLHDAHFDKYACFTIGHPTRVEYVVKQDNHICVMNYKTPKPGYVAQLMGTYTYLLDQNLHEGFSDTSFDWLYDEFDFSGTRTEDIYSHSILLSNGVEITILFTEFHFAYAEIKVEI